MVEIRIESIRSHDLFDSCIPLPFYISWLWALRTFCGCRFFGCGWGLRNIYIGGVICWRSVFMLLFMTTRFDEMIWNLLLLREYCVPQRMAKINIWQGWAECVSFSDFEAYRRRFVNAQEYFKPRFPEATKIGNEMLRRLVEKTGSSSTSTSLP